MVHDRFFYQISERMFVPVELHMENVKYLFGRYSVIKTDKNDLYRLVGVWDTYFRKLTKGDDEFSRVMTLTDICTQFNISPGGGILYRWESQQGGILAIKQRAADAECHRNNERGGVSEREVRKLKKKLGWL